MIHDGSATYDSVDSLTWPPPTVNTGRGGSLETRGGCRGRRGRARGVADRGASLGRRGGGRGSRGGARGQRSRARRTQLWHQKWSTPTKNDLRVDFGSSPALKYALQAHEHTKVVLANVKQRSQVGPDVDMSKVKPLDIFSLLMEDVMYKLEKYTAQTFHVRRHKHKLPPLKRHQFMSFLAMIFWMKTFVADAKDDCIKDPFGMRVDRSSFQ